MDTEKIIQKFYDKESRLYKLLIIHSKAVTKKAIEIAKRIPHLHPDIKFIEEAAMLHDIWIFLTHYPKMDCFGNNPYICHGYLGREILEKEGLPKHALVCERHTGTGISREEIMTDKLPIPARDMLPISIEEQIICYADMFFSKIIEPLDKEIEREEIRKERLTFGKEKLYIFDQWTKKFWK